MKPAPSKVITDGELINQVSASPEEREPALWRLIGQGRLNDPKIAAAVARFFGDYSPEVLAEFLDRLPRDGSNYTYGNAYSEYLLSLKDYSTLTSRLEVLRDDSRPWILQRMAEQSPSFTPSTLRDFEQLCRNEADRTALCEGVRLRLLKLTQKERITLGQQYLDANTVPAVSRVVVEESVRVQAGSDLKRAADWLLTLNDDAAGSGDSLVLQALAKDDPKEGMAYLEKLGLLSQPGRSSAGLEEFAAEYAKFHPAEALPWVQQLPAGMKAAKTTIFISGVAQLYEKDPELAEQYRRNLTDPETLTALQERYPARVPSLESR